MIKMVIRMVWIFINLVSIVFRLVVTRVTLWRIRNLMYLDMKIEEWPSRAKLGQAGPNRAIWCQTGSNGAKWGQMGPKMAKKCLTGPNVAKRANGAKQGQMGSYGADFLHARIFL